jgi:ribosomal protein L11 methyltransferase
LDWIEISVLCDGEGAEAVSELFNRYNSGPEGRGGAVVDIGGFNSVGELTQPTITVRTYLPDNDQGRALRQRIEEGLYHLGRIYPLPDPRLRVLAETDWAEAWKAHYRPLRVGQRLLITPSWLTPEAAPDDLVIELDPGMAFGSGLHPSTRLCLTLLEKRLRSGDGVLDLGTGSGILAIAAAKLGAGSVLARDVDEVAVQVAQENVAGNTVSHRVRVEVGSLPGSPEIRAQGSGFGVSESGDAGGEAQTWDLILVNILADVIVDLLGQGLSSLLAPDGRLILSGIIQTRARDVEAALQAHELTVMERLQEGDWLALLAERLPIV